MDDVNTAVQFVLQIDVIIICTLSESNEKISVDQFAEIG